MAAFPASLIATGYGLAALPAAGLALAGHGLAAFGVLWLGGAAAVLLISAVPLLARAFPRRSRSPGPRDSLIARPQKAAVRNGCD